MAKDKKSFLLYVDLIHTVKHLPDEKAGQLFKTILGYVNDEDPEPEDLLVQVTFEPIKQQLKRDLEKYERIREKNKKNAEKRWNAVASDRKGTDTKNAVSDKVTDTDKETVKVKETIEERSAAFYQKLAALVDDYGKETVRDFYNYWTEHNEGGKKMRFELAKNQPFNIKRRLNTWKQKENTYGSSKNSKRGTAQTTAERQDY